MTKNYAKVSANEPKLINVNDAKKKGIVIDDVAVVFNSKGEILVGAFAIAICKGA